MKVALDVDPYEYANLRALFEAIFCGNRHDPISALDTGDWCGQLLFKLRDLEGFWEANKSVAPVPPANATPEQMIERVRIRAGYAAALRDPLAPSPTPGERA